jgi:hypothetical protein
MEDEFVTPEIALKVKELGFNEKCIAIYRKDRLMYLSAPEIINSTKISVIAAPLWQQVTDWMYSNYKILISLYLPKDKSHLLWWVKSDVDDFYGDKQYAFLKAIEYAKESENNKES